MAQCWGTNLCSLPKTEGSCCSSSPVEDPEVGLAVSSFLILNRMAKFPLNHHLCIINPLHTLLTPTTAPSHEILGLEHNPSGL